MYEDTRPTRRRYWVVLLLFFLTLINYMDKEILSVAAPTLKKVFDLDPALMGVALSVLSWGYVVALIPAGLGTDRFGARKMGAVAMIVWSLSTAVTGFAGSFGVLMGTRALVGIGESPTLPVAASATKQWAAAKERGFFTGLWNTGTTVGSGVGAVFSALLIFQFGWRAAFWVLGGIGLLWAGVWLLFYRRPEDTKWLPAGERTHILASRQSSEADTATTERPVPLTWLLRQRPMWGLLLTEGCIVYTMYFLLTWLPSFLNQTRHVEVLAGGILSGIPYLIAAFAVFGLTYLSDRLAPGNRDRGTRRWFVALYLVLSIVLIAVPGIDNVVLLEVVLAWALAMNSAASALNLAMVTDLVTDPRSVGRAMALTVVGGNVLGLLGPLVTGFLVSSTGSFGAAFAVAVVLMLLGAALSMTLSNRQLRPSPEGVLA
jgi:MFS family permease